MDPTRSVIPSAGAIFEARPPTVPGAHLVGCRLTHLPSYSSPEGESNRDVLDNRLRIAGKLFEEAQHAPVVNLRLLRLGVVARIWNHDNLAFRVCESLGFATGSGNLILLTMTDAGSHLISDKRLLRRSVVGSSGEGEGFGVAGDADFSRLLSVVAEVNGKRSLVELWQIAVPRQCRPGLRIGDTQQHFCTRSSRHCEQRAQRGQVR